MNKPIQHNTVNMKYLAYGVMLYMLLALVWWTILLSNNNSIIFSKNLEIERINPYEITELPYYKSVLYKIHHDEYLKRKYMIFGEGLVFGVLLILGVWMIQNAYDKEMENTQNQKNFLLSITHELKTPITSIGLISETMLKRKLHAAVQSDMLESIIAENKRLETLVSKLLMAAKLDNNYVFNFQRVSLLEILEKQKKILKITHPEVAINIEHGNLVPDVECDEEAIFSVFSNIIENSIKYSESPANIRVIFKDHAYMLEIIFIDTGYGIPENEKSKILQPFYRIGNEETRNSKGTGLGLYIVNKIVEGHQGYLKFSDNDPHGTVVSLSLPTIQTI